MALVRTFSLNISWLIFSLFNRKKKSLFSPPFFLRETISRRSTSQVMGISDLFGPWVGRPTSCRPNKGKAKRRSATRWRSQRRHGHTFAAPAAPGAAAARFSQLVPRPAIRTRQVIPGSSAPLSYASSVLAKLKRRWGVEICRYLSCDSCSDAG
jgi:hypothetical protein